MRVQILKAGRNGLMRNQFSAITGSCNAVCMTTGAKAKKNPAAVALGRLGGLKGGAARAKALTAAERKRIAQKAAAVRWKNKATRKP